MTVPSSFSQVTSSCWWRNSELSGEKTACEAGVLSVVIVPVSSTAYSPAFLPHPRLQSTSARYDDPSTPGLLQAAHNTKWHLSGSGNCPVSMDPFNSPGFWRERLVYEQYCFFFRDLPQENVLLEEALFSPQRAGEAPWNRRRKGNGLFQGRKLGMFRKIPPDQGRVRRWHREWTQEGRRDGRNCKEHTAIAISWAFRRGKMCSPAGVTPCVFVALFVKERLSPGCTAQAECAARSTAWHTPLWLAHLRFYNKPRSKPKLLLHFYTQIKSLLFAEHCLFFFFFFLCNERPFTVPWRRVQIQAFLTHTVLKWLSNLCVSLSFFCSFHTPIDTKLRQTLKTKDLSRHV